MYFVIMIHILHLFWKLMQSEREQKYLKAFLGSLFRWSVMLLNDFKWDSFRNYMLFVTTVVGLPNKKGHDDFVSVIRGQ